MPNSGYPYVRAKVADYLNRHGFFEDIDAGQIVMTTGAAGALNVVLKTLLNTGDEVVVPRPYFFEYRFYIDTHGGRLVLVDTDDAFGLDIDKMAEAITERTRAVIITSPNNPTGRVYSRDDLDALIDCAHMAEEIVGHPLPGKLIRGGSLTAIRARTANA